MTKIGIVCNEQNQITTLMEATKVVVYEQNEQKWNKALEITRCFGKRSTINEMREFLKLLCDELKDCNILVASILTGIPYMVLDKAGFMLCEVQQFSHQLLEEIAYDYASMLQKHEQKKEQKPDYPQRPYETSNRGIYELDMAKLQACHPEISSKMAIIPFLKEEKFYQLQVLCSHVMPWLDRELEPLGYQYQTSRLSEGYLVEIEKLCCE
jgi:Fe-only nitrogenase accessory protein AnfO